MAAHIPGNLNADLVINEHGVVVNGVWLPVTTYKVEQVAGSPYATVTISFPAEVRIETSRSDTTRSQATLWGQALNRALAASAVTDEEH